MASGEESSESLRCKTWVLRVSIHCEGCKKKVNRILRNIQGVYDSEIDARQHKVTVKASVDVETLIRKLEKSGKHAVLWPEKKPNINQNANNGSAGSEKEDKETSATKEPSENPEKKPIISSETSPVASSTEAMHLDAKAAPIEEPTNPSAKPEEAEVEAKAKSLAEPPSPNAQTEESKAKSLAEPPNPNAQTEESDTKMPQNSEPEKADTPTQQSEKLAAPVAPAEAEIIEKDSTGVKEDGDNGGVKKKSTKAQKNIREDARTNLDSRSFNPTPPQEVYSYPAHAPPQPPEYVMSYNVAQPTINHAYYAPPMPPASQGYVCMPYPPPEFYYGSFDPSLTAPLQQPPPHHYMFNEENPNACYIM